MIQLIVDGNEKWIKHTIFSASTKDKYAAFSCYHGKVLPISTITLNNGMNATF